jgi:hypothetical protein
MSAVHRLVVDVLKPHEPPLVEFTERIAATDGVGGATASLLELDREVQNVELAIEGEGIDYGTVEERIEELGATVHSVDEVACGSAPAPGPTRG